MLSGKKIVVVSENEEPQKKKRKTLNLDPKRAEQMERMFYFIL
jgi:glycerol-3-phosphate cytidylyltransferase-like family protein